MLKILTHVAQTLEIYNSHVKITVLKRELRERRHHFQKLLCMTAEIKEHYSQVTVETKQF